MSKAILTSRTLKNTATGIDITVPEFRTFSKLLTTQEEYHVIVITRLAYFKTEDHKEEDVVQFMVPKLYGDFEALHKAMTDRYPATIFPELPKKILIVRDSTPQQRRAAFERLLQFIAASQKVCTSPLLLEFLGVSKDKMNSVDGSQADPEPETTDGGSREGESASKSPTKSVKSQSSSLFGEDDSDDELFKTGKEEVAEEEETDSDLFSTPYHQSSAHTNGGAGDELIVSEDTRTVTETELQDSLFLAQGGASVGVTSSEVLGMTQEDNSDLLNVEDDLEKLLTVSAKPKPSPKPRSLASPTKPPIKPRPSPKPSTGTATKPEPTMGALDKSGDAAELMAEDDIMRYIQENSESGDAKLDLF